MASVSPVDVFSKGAKGGDYGPSEPSALGSKGDRGSKHPICDFPRIAAIDVANDSKEEEVIIGVDLSRVRLAPPPDVTLLKEDELTAFEKVEDCGCDTPKENHMLCTKCGEHFCAIVVQIDLDYFESVEDWEKYHNLYDSMKCPYCSGKVWRSLKEVKYERRSYDGSCCNDRYWSTCHKCNLPFGCKGVMDDFEMSRTCRVCLRV